MSPLPDLLRPCRLLAWLCAIILLSLHPTVRSQPLPRLEWSTYHGGSLEDGFRDMAIDADANIYVTGSTLSPDAIATPGSHLATPGGLSDVYIAKYNADGVRLWSTYFGGFDHDYGQGITVDDMGNVYVTGFTASFTGIASFGAHQMTNNGGFADAFIAKFDPNGNRLWATYFGGAEDERANSICIDRAGNITIIGWTNSASLIASPGAFQTTFQGQQDIFLAHFNNNGTRLWSTYFGFDGLDIGLQVMADAANDLFISGWTSSTSNFATPGAFKTTYSGGTADTYLAKFTETGSRLWSTYYGGSIDEYGDALLVTDDGDIYLAGPCNSPDGISTSGSYQPSTAGGFDSFLVKFDATGSRIWGTYYGGADDDLGYGLATDAEQSIYLTGYTKSTSSIATANAHQTMAGGDWDAYVIRFTVDGTPLWGTYLGGPATDQSLGVEVDTAGYVYISGLTVSNSQISTTGSHQETYGGGDSDGFVSKFSPCSDPIVSFNNSGYLCISSNFVFDLTFTGNPPYTITYSLDGVEQPPVIALTSPYYFTVTDPWIDSIKLLSVSSGPCMGQITGLFDFVKIVEPVAASNVNILCNQTTETFTVTGDLSGGVFNYISVGSTNLFISGNQFTSTSLPFGTDYAIAISSGLQCDTVFLMGPSGCMIQCPDTIGTIIPDTLVCDGTDIMLHAEGGLSYAWSGPDNFSSALQQPVVSGATGLNGGTYVVEITDSDGCKDTLYTDVTIQSVNGSVITDATLCAGEDLQLLASGGVSYQWNGPGGFVSSLSNPIIPNAQVNASGTYIVLITDGLGCTTSLDVTNTVHALPIVIAGSNSPVCEGGTIELSATPGMIDYEWNGPDGFTSIQQNPTHPLATTLDSGMYVLTVTDINSCSNSDSVLVSVVTAPVISLVVTGTLCEGTSMDLSASGAADWVWSGPNGFTSNLADTQITSLSNVNSGLYTLIGSNAGGCSDTVAQMINILPLPVIRVTAADTILCEGQQLQLQATPASMYMWTGPDGFNSEAQYPAIAFINLSQAGMYAVTVTDANMCTAAGALTIIVHDIPDLVLTFGETEVCEGETVWIEVTSDALTYNWTGPGGFVASGTTISVPNATILDSGWYVVNAVDTDNCSARDSIAFTIHPKPIASVSGPDKICEGESVTLTASGGSTFLWNTLSAMAIITEMPTDTMVYEVIVGEGNCTDTTDHMVAVNPLPELIISTPVTITNLESTMLQISGATTYSWSPPFSLDCATCADPVAAPDSTTLYCVTGELNGCVSTACVLVTVIIDCGFSVPNIFSPNFDGTNDQWCSPQPFCYTKQSLTIYDRWGNALYSTSGQDVCWDGTSRGRDVLPGVYVYMLELRDGSNQTVYKRGDVTVVR